MEKNKLYKVKQDFSVGGKKGIVLVKKNQILLCLNHMKIVNKEIIITFLIEGKVYCNYYDTDDENNLFVKIEK